MGPKDVKCFGVVRVRVPPGKFFLIYERTDIFGYFERYFTSIAPKKCMKFSAVIVKLSIGLFVFLLFFRLGGAN